MLDFCLVSVPGNVRIAPPTATAPTTRCGRWGGRWLSGRSSRRSSRSAASAATAAAAAAPSQPPAAAPAHVSVHLLPHGLPQPIETHPPPADALAEDARVPRTGHNGAAPLAPQHGRRRPALALRLPDERRCNGGHFRQRYPGAGGSGGRRLWHRHGGGPIAGQRRLYLPKFNGQLLGGQRRRWHPGVRGAFGHIRRKWRWPAARHGMRKWRKWLGGCSGNGWQR